MTEPESKDETVYVFVKKKFVVAWVTTFLIMLISVGALFQYVNYLDRRSQQRSCGLVVIFDTNYTQIPPESKLGKQMAVDLKKLTETFNCK